MSEPEHDALKERTRFDPAEVEPRILEAWLSSGLFHPEAERDRGDNYSIAFPPPNVTGDLHMGHALQVATQDTLIRYHRMLGQPTKFILGTDHAGIGTQMQVEKQLAREGTTRQAIGRDAFLERIWAWKELHGSNIVDQLKRLGASLDYSEERFTLDEAYAAAVMHVFVRLFDRGLIYRGNYMVNWDPGSRSAISDLEVEEREVADTLYSIAYPFAEGDGEVVVATVRPETMLADTAVAVHPDDERYREYVGREVVLPLVGRRLRVIADVYVKPEFGTGVLKITPGHDPNDFEIGRSHGLEELSVIGEDGRISDAAGPRFAGLSIERARAAVVAALEQEGVLRGSEPYTHKVPFSHRSGERIEPLISLQWFMRMDELARPAIDVVIDGRVRFHPEQQGRVYREWMDNIRPWCISRQLWWGHRLPVYYCDACEETYVTTAPPERCGACDGRLRQDEDVLDTWFSSALYPFATLGWPQDAPELRAFYPTDVLVTGRDIIFLWVARMIMMGIEFCGTEPFSDVYITSIIQAPDGRRMSKSLGTGIDPVEEIDRHGADAVRFGMLAMSSTQDVKYSAEKVAQGQGLANKLFNASRFVLMSIDPDAPAQARPAAIEDRWILSRLARIEAEVTLRLARFDFAHAALGLYDFVYGELCDWYLELVKGRLAGAGDDRVAVSSTLLHVLRETLALAHPMIPFVTEEVWSFVRRPDEGLLVGAAFPVADEDRLDPAAEAELAWAIAATQAVRGWRDEVGIKPKVVMPVRVLSEGHDEVVGLVARMARLRLDEGAESAACVASVGVPGGTVEVLAGEGVDLGAHADRLEKRRTGLRAEIDGVRRKLGNAAFVAKAPPAVVDGVRERLAGLESELEAL
ncbi:MAG: valyl-tRNA synthetase [Solirubrobacteraceae bacterium]|jgi:valyl-tRNA synthetase|nr:valyl-tRNA synthetase [Solirubrobacteraceae bacterium]